MDGRIGVAGNVDADDVAWNMIRGAGRRGGVRRYGAQYVLYILYCPIR